MIYTITSKTGPTPKPLQGIKTFEQVNNLINTFMQFNPKNENVTFSERLAYYNKESFYQVKNN